MNVSTPAEPHHHQGERAATFVLLITLVAMAAEIGAGWWTQSMALTADGWHMGMHAAAMAVAVVAYRFTRRHRASGRYGRGAGKAVDLGGFANAVLLALVALLVAFESAERLLRPEPIEFHVALIVAALGLVVNLLSAWLLRDDHHHDRHHHHHDHNREAAFIHVLADAATSALAIIALFGGERFGLVWLDPLVGLIGAAVILNWALALARRTSAVLLDAAPGSALLEAIGATVCDAGDELLLLRAWPVAADRYAVTLWVRTSRCPAYAGRIAMLPGVVDVAIDWQSPGGSDTSTAHGGQCQHDH